MINQTYKSLERRIEWVSSLQQVTVSQGNTGGSICNAKYKAGQENTWSDIHYI